MVGAMIMDLEFVSSNDASFSGLCWQLTDKSVSLILWPFSSPSQSPFVIDSSYTAFHFRFNDRRETLGDFFFLLKKKGFTSKP